MPRKLRPYLLALAAALCACAQGLGQVRDIDYTKADQSLKKDNIKKEQWSGQNSAWSGSESRAPKKEYKPGGDASRLQNKRVPSVDSAGAQDLQNKRSPSDKRFSSPELENFKEKWAAPSDNVFLENKNKDLSKKYDGKIDTGLMHSQNAQMKEALEKIREKSMGEINKYMFRASHEYEDGVKTMTAGGEILGREEGSFWGDLFSSDTHISRKSVSFKKPLDVGAISKQSDAPNGAQKKAAPANSTKVLPPIVQNESPKPKSAPAAPERKVKVLEKEFTKDTSLFAPRAEEGPIRATSKFKIKVEVSDP